MPEIQTNLKFYSPWPKFGKRLNFQWGESRQDIAVLKAVARAQVHDVETGDDFINADRVLAGLEFGEMVSNVESFKNQFRLFYDKVNDKFCIQRNAGTEAVPIWVDYLCIDQVSGLVTVIGLDAGPLGISSSGGFYGLPDQRMQVIGEIAPEGTEFTPPHTDALWFNSADFYLTPKKNQPFAGTPVVNLKNSFGLSKIFNASGGEWVINHSFGVTPVMVQVFDDQDRVIIPGEADVSDPNTAYFYFDSSISGKVIISTGGLGAAELVPLDTFYLVVRRSDRSDVPGFHTFADVVFDKDDFYVSYRPAQHQTIIELARAGSGGGLSSIVVQETDGNPPAFNTDTITFDSTDFYLTTDSSGKPIVSFRNRFTGGTFVHSQGTAAGEWIVTHNLNNKDVIVQVFDLDDRVIEADEIDTSDPNVTYFYFVGSVTGKAVVTSGAGAGGSGGGGGSSTDTASNLGAGEGVFASKVGSDFQFKSLTEGIGINLTSTGTEIQIASTIAVEETDGNPPQFNKNTLIFNSNHFYLSPDASGDPIVNLRVDLGASTFEFEQPVPAAEWIVTHNLNQSPVLVQTFNTVNRMIGFDEVDVGDPNITYFYFTKPIAGRALIVSRAAAAGGGGSPLDITDGTNVNENIVEINLNSNQFYLTKDLGGNPVVNWDLKNGYSERETILSGDSKNIRWNWSQNNAFFLALQKNTTIHTPDGLPSGSRAQQANLVIKQPVGTEFYTIVWSKAFIWAGGDGGGEPTQESGATDLFSFHYSGLLGKIVSVAVTELFY